MLNTLVLAQQGPSGLAKFIASIMPILLIGVIFYLLIFLPMRKRQKGLEKLIAGLKNGDRVITSSGIYGTIAGVKEHTFLLKVADQVKIEVAKNAIASLQTAPERS